MWLWQNSRLPPLQLRQCPHVTCFAGDPLADLEAADVGAELFDLAHELVADDHRHGNRRLRPRVPVEDVQVRAAYRRLPDPDQHLAITGRRLGYVFQPQAGLGLGFDERLHGTRPIARPTRANASIASSMSLSLCAADICVRIRALPFGTTGNEKAIT